MTKRLAGLARRLLALLVAEDMPFPEIMKKADEPAEWLPSDAVSPYLVVMAESKDTAKAGDGNGSAPCPPSFETALGQLEHIVHQLEEGEIGLAEALEHYEKGIGLLKQCYGLLERAERRIELLSGVDAAGNPITEPFHDESLSLDEKSQNRARRRTNATAKPAKSDAVAADDAVMPACEITDSAQTRMDEPGSLF